VKVEFLPVISERTKAARIRYRRFVARLLYIASSNELLSLADRSLGLSPDFDSSLSCCFSSSLFSSFLSRRRYSEL